MSNNLNLQEIINIRRELHANPELGYHEYNTAKLIASYLTGWGIAVETGIAETGVVGILSKGTSDRMIGLRADIDALPMQDKGTQPWKSKNPGVAHACGHDGHTAILLGVARELAKNVDFDGKVCFIFQPAEEGLAGAKRMINEGLFQRYPCDAVYALHNWPELNSGSLMTCPGPIMAAGDIFEIELYGDGGHAAQPHLTQDVTLAMSEMVIMLNTITSRALHPCEPAVITVTKVECGTSHNMIPSHAKITGTARMFSRSAQDLIEEKIHRHIMNIAEVHGIKASFNYIRCYPATINHHREAKLALQAGESADLSSSECSYPALTSEDFCYMLESKPGAYVWLGSAPSFPLHNPAFDFNDDVIGHGINWFINVVSHEFSAM